VYAAHLLVLGTWIWVFKSRYGKVLIGLGDNPDGLYRRGYRTTHIRYAYLMISGLLAGTAAFIYMFSVDLGWRGSNASYDGIGWFVFALLMIGNWRPFRTMLFAYLYVFLSLGFQLMQASQTAFSVQAINLIPQAIIILLLAIIHIGERRWMITPINKILSQEYTFVRSLSDTISTSAIPEAEVKISSKG
jgi:simple sugar transport system permease protein